ncbi:hypothetical protein L3Q82_011249, partial [Scortum barcoo]
ELASRRTVPLLAAGTMPWRHTPALTLAVSHGKMFPEFRSQAWRYKAKSGREREREREGCQGSCQQQRARAGLVPHFNGKGFLLCHPLCVKATRIHYEALALPIMAFSEKVRFDDDDDAFPPPLASTAKQPCWFVLPVYPSKGQVSSDFLKGALSGVAQGDPAYSRDLNPRLRGAGRKSAFLPWKVLLLFTGW